MSPHYLPELTTSHSPCLTQSAPATLAFLLFLYFSQFSPTLRLFYFAKNITQHCLLATSPSSFRTWYKAKPLPYEVSFHFGSVHLCACITCLITHSASLLSPRTHQVLSHLMSLHLLCPPPRIPPSTL